jgi:hypothetical protein
MYGDPYLCFKASSSTVAPRLKPAQRPLPPQPLPGDVGEFIRQRSQEPQGPRKRISRSPFASREAIRRCRDPLLAAGIMP